MSRSRTAAPENLARDLGARFCTLRGHSAVNKKQHACPTDSDRISGMQSSRSLWQMVQACELVKRSVGTAHHQLVLRDLSCPTPAQWAA